MLAFKVVQHVSESSTESIQWCQHSVVVVGATHVQSYMGEVQVATHTWKLSCCVGYDYLKAVSVSVEHILEARFDVFYAVLSGL